VQIAMAAVVAAFTFTATPATAAKQDRIAVLQRQVKALQKQVKALRQEVDANYEGDGCLAAGTADAFQGTWGVIDQIAQAVQTKTYFGAQTPVNDFNACAGLQPAVPRSHAVPPQVGFFSALIDWLHG